MEKKNSYFALMMLCIIINLASASDEYYDSDESDPIHGIKHEIILDLLNKLNTGTNENSISVPLVKKMGHKRSFASHHTKTKSKFKIFNVNKLFNPAGLGL